MPRYDYYCKNCDVIFEIIKSMKDCNSEELCPDCENIMVKQFMGQNIGTSNKSMKEIVSHGLAMCPSQIPEHNKLFPDIKVRSDGCPVFDDIKKYDDYMNRTGIFKERQRSRKRGKIIKKSEMMGVK